MSFEVPTTLSPSKVSAFKECALAFRFSVIDKIPQPPSVPAVKGTTVHRALELLFNEPAPERTIEAARDFLQVALEEISTDPEFEALGLESSEVDQFKRDTAKMVDRYFTLEDPQSIIVVGTEMMIEADLDGVTIRGIIDRLEETPDGELIVTDYKTGRTPGVQQEQARMEGIHFYSLLCEQTLGRRPSSVQLMYLGSNPQIIVAHPSDQTSRGTRRRLSAVWNAIDTACANEDFRPRPSRLCDWCSYKDFCPAFGGDPALATAELSN